MKSTDIFLITHENVCCGYSLEAPHQGASNEYPQHTFSLRNKKNIMWIPLLSGAMRMWCLIRVYSIVPYLGTSANSQ